MYRQYLPDSQYARKLGVSKRAILAGCLALLQANRIGSTNTAAGGSNGPIEYAAVHASFSRAIEASLMLIHRELVFFRWMLRIFTCDGALLTK